MDHELLWLCTEVKTPPFSRQARIETGRLLRLLQRGHRLGLPHSRPMPTIGPACHELRIQDADKAWRVVYHLDSAEGVIVVLGVFSKHTPETPRAAIQACGRRLRQYQGG